ELFAPNVSRCEAALALTTKYIVNQCQRDLNREIAFFDVVMNLVEDLTFYKYLQAAEKTERNKILEEEKQEKEAQVKVLDIDKLIEKSIEEECFDILISACIQMHSAPLFSKPIPFIIDQIELFSNVEPYNIDDYKCGKLSYNSPYNPTIMEEGSYIRKGDCLGVLILMEKEEGNLQECGHVYLYSPCSGYLIKNHVTNMTSVEDINEYKISLKELVISTPIKTSSILMTLSPVYPSKSVSNIIKRIAI
ncbi:MAG TPA: hypothetical protein VIC51_13555, partial [Psychromonas sp.]